MAKTVAILGAGGSVGTQAQDVARTRGYRVDFLSGNKNVAATEAAVREFCPTWVAMADEESALDLRSRIKDTSTKVLAGEAGICEGIAHSNADTVVNSILGKAGLMPTLATLDSGKRLALANKESLVIAGDIVMRKSAEANAEIIPVDSEHSAIFQSLKSGRPCEVKRLLLTASGGPFFGKSREELRSVTLSDTLAHPTWKMGRKITVDSATLMNKGFEIIEAVHLFGIPADKIEVVIHRESILHSAVEYIDNSVVGELSSPDMRACVQYAIDYPARMSACIQPLDLFSLGSLTFARPDYEAFPALSLAKRAVNMGGGCGAVLNAADEVAVEAFLEDKIGFADIYEAVSYTFEKLTMAENAVTLDQILLYDEEARARASEYIAKHTK